MKKYKNTYSYDLHNGSVTGFFNIYQAKNGRVYLQMATSKTELTLDQINDLHICVYELKDFDYDAFNRAYPTGIYSL